MIRARLATPWATDTRYGFPTNALRVSVDYSLSSCQQVDRANPPAPALAEIVCDDATWTRIQGDATYSGGIQSSSSF